MTITQEQFNEKMDALDAANPGPAARLAAGKISMPSDPWSSPDIARYLPNPQPVVVQYYIGCICPAGANKDCERPDCPRKNPMKEHAR